MSEPESDYEILITVRVYRMGRDQRTEGISDNIKCKLKKAGVKL